MIYSTNQMIMQFVAAFFIYLMCNIVFFCLHMWHQSPPRSRSRALRDIAVLNVMIIVSATLYGLLHR